jgi:hypothetical protein
VSPDVGEQDQFHVTFSNGQTQVRVGGRLVEHLEVTIEADTRFGEPIVVVRARLSSVHIHGEPDDGN